MAAIESKNAVSLVYFDGGQTDEGKLIRKSKTYRNIVKNAEADSLYTALEQLAQLSEFPFIGANIVETSNVNN